MKRNQLYAQLVGKRELKDEIKALFGKPFTNVSTSELENFLNSKKEAARHKKPTPKLQSKKKDCGCVPGADHDVDLTHFISRDPDTRAQLLMAISSVGAVAIKLEKLMHMLSERGILLEEELNVLNEYYKL